MADYTEKALRLIASIEERMLYEEQPCATCEGTGRLSVHYSHVPPTHADIRCRTCDGVGSRLILKKQGQVIDPRVAVYAA